PADEEYVRRRYQSSIAPGAWETLAAARFRRPGLDPPALPSSTRAYQRISFPVLVVEGAGDKILPAGWAAEVGAEVSGGRSVVMDKGGDCAEIEEPPVVNKVLLDFLDAEAQRKVSA